MLTIAPAKINWTLEVLGRREDGYHEIRSVIQTIDLCDEVWADRSQESVFETMDGKPLADDDLIVRAAKALDYRMGRALPARIRVEKRIPLASGLGGGSSDAAAVLRLLDRLYELGLPAEQLASIAATMGSDVPFFVYGGTALVEGRGERVKPLPDAPGIWTVVVSPPAQEHSNKTAAMYAQLRAEDFSDGSYSEAFAFIVKQGVPPHQATLPTIRKLFHEGVSSEKLPNANVFERHTSPPEGVELALMNAIPGETRVAGSGPAMFSVLGSEMEARLATRRVQAEIGSMGVSSYFARTLGAREATAITD